MAKKKKVKDLKRREYDRRYREKKPWVPHICWAKRRCTDPRWKSHHGKEHTLTAEQGEYLWLRDGASEMEKPSLDRIDTSKGYTLDNCRFMEWLENVRLPHGGQGSTDGPAPEFT